LVWLFFAKAAYSDRKKEQLILFGYLVWLFAKAAYSDRLIGLSLEVSREDGNGYLKSDIQLISPDKKMDIRRIHPWYTNR